MFVCVSVWTTFLCSACVNEAFVEGLVLGVAAPVLRPLDIHPKPLHVDLVLLPVAATQPATHQHATNQPAQRMNEPTSKTTNEPTNRHRPIHNARRSIYQVLEYMYMYPNTGIRIMQSVEGWCGVPDQSRTTNPSKVFTWPAGSPQRGHGNMLSLIHI